MTIKYYYMFSISSGSKRGDFANTELEDPFSLFKNTHRVWLELSLCYMRVSMVTKRKKNINYKSVFVVVVVLNRQIV